MTSRLSTPCLVALALTGAVLSTLSPLEAQRQREGRRARAQEAPQAPAPAEALPQEWTDALRARSIGPANMGGRITALAVVESNPSTWYAATASGGLLKTTNNGITFEHQFDQEATVSIGDVQVSQSHPDVVWIGTGESNPRNSVSWGNGVYKSTDGGASWQHMGLEGTFQIGRLAIHPEDPDIVYVGALGRLWGPNEERGLFKTVDGGASWEKILYVDEHTGVVDVNLHPEDPNTLLVATYERERDEFDTNDPAKKWGPGSGLWKSTDAGATFRRLSQGLPTVDLGRVDIEYFRSDPNVVYALVESSRIGEEPENAAYIGVRGEDADVGARLTEITGEGPAEAAGLQEGDIVIGFGDETVQSYDDLVAKVRGHLAGDTVTLEVSRDRKSVEVELTFTTRPDAQEDRRTRDPQADQVAEAAPAEAPQAAEVEVTEAAAPAEGSEAEPVAGEAAGAETDAGSAEAEPAAQEPASEPETEAATEAKPEAEAEEEEEEEERRRPSPFRTGLGGQVPNVQHQQGPDGHEYGGLYKSTDGGETWTRINSVNPRPMYFSQVRVDPSDDQHIYVLGISLYRSKDGGETFTSDGARGGVHVDHHAMWIDPEDGRHVILGNDGGIYITFDRLERWDHYNHVAIGQFYHVAVGPRPNYWVYGGLQDNGTWGGPTHARSGSGTRNEDWVSIGGGDGFICRVDPNDPDQIYFESQNGGLGRRNLRTGERSSMRPRGERGQRLRWNWRTPFILSNHNSGIYYTAGNHVFRSWLQGDDLKAISPEITRTDRGSATALAESPFDAGVLYVGSDDGALWRTKDGGHTWDDLFAREAEPRRRPGPGEAIEASATNGEHGQEAKPEAALVGQWNLDMGGGSTAPRDQGSRRGRRSGGGGGGFSMSFELKLDAEGALTGSLQTFGGSRDLSQSSFDPLTQALRLDFEETVVEGTLEDGALSGTVDFSGRFQRDFTGTRGGEEEQRPDDGYEWNPIGDLVPIALYVSSIEPSGFEESRVYMTLDGHRSNDDKPHVFVSEDYGNTWRDLNGNLPVSAGSTRVLREDLVNPDLLYLGTEFGAWVTLDRGTTWTELDAGLPTVAVHELAQHPTNGELVLGTHGRSLWVVDVSPLRGMIAGSVAAEARLYPPRNATYWRTQPSTGGTLRRFVAQNAPTSADIYYSLGRDADNVALRVKDAAGEVVAELDAPGGAGLHRVSWNLRASGGESGGRRSFRAPRVDPGTYTVELRRDNETLVQPLTVQGDPEFPDAVLWGVEYELQMELERRLQEGDEEEAGPEVDVL